MRRSVESHHTPGMMFHHPVAFFAGCVLVTLGVLAHVPMFMHAAAMGYRMVGMPMDATMLTGMGLIPIGLLLSSYGLMPRLAELQNRPQTQQLFHIEDIARLNSRHWQLVIVLFVAVAVDVMKPATLGFVIPGMIAEYGISKPTASTTALVALTGTTLGSILWGRLADVMGRRAAILLSALMFIGTAICGAMPSFEWNLAMCFLMGLSAGGLLPIAFILMAEIIPASHRGWLLVALGGLGTSAGYLLASGSAAILEPLFSWRMLWLLGLPTGLLLIFLNRYIPESPRFLQSHGLRDQALAGHRFYGSRFTQELVPATGTRPPKYSSTAFRDVFGGAYAPITIGLLGVGLSWGLVNFGFLLWLPNNLREVGMSAEAANGLLARSGLMALPGTLAVIWLYHKWSSIKTLVLFNLLTAVSLAVFFAMDLFGVHSPLAVMLAIALLLVSASGVVAMLIPYGAEIYPVQIRGTGTGLVASSSKAGGIIGALLSMIGVFSDLGVSALIIIASILVFTFLLSLSGVDTRGRTLEEINANLLLRTSGSRF